MRPLKRILLLPIFLFHLCSWAQVKPKETVKEFVTKLYFHGLPYDEAKSYGIAAVPELTAMLKDKSVEKYWPNIVVTLGYIGDSSATKPLIQFIEGSKGEISIHRFKAILRVFQALGHISQSGDNTSLKTLNDYTSVTSWKTKSLQFKYSQYSEQALSEVLARQAIVGLGISGRPEALKKINELKQSKQTRTDWKDNLNEAETLNLKVKAQGAQKVFGNPTN